MVNGMLLRAELGLFELLLIVPVSRRCKGLPASVSCPLFIQLLPRLGNQP
jgi:hypothetical protein